MLTRDARRHQAARAKARACRQLDLFRLDPSPHLVGRYARTRKPCSCIICGNPRKWFKQPTRKEVAP